MYSSLLFQTSLCCSLAWCPEAVCMCPCQSSQPGSRLWSLLLAQAASSMDGLQVSVWKWAYAKAIRILVEFSPCHKTNAFCMVSFSKVPLCTSAAAIAPRRPPMSPNAPRGAVLTVLSLGSAVSPFRSPRSKARNGAVRPGGVRSGVHSVQGGEGPPLHRRRSANQSCTSLLCVSFGF